MTVFGNDLALEPHFVDESAYISQSFYADLWLDGKWDSPLWLSYGGYDIPPLPKYLIGLTFRVAEVNRPGPSAMVAWYGDTSRTFVARSILVLARWPSVFLGVAGVLAVHALGALGFDRRAGFLAGLLVAFNPLYALHARRAMSDVPAEAFLLGSLAVGLWAWKRMLAGRGTAVPALALALAAGILVGLATLCKLNGSLAGFVLGAWAILALSLREFPIRNRVGISIAVAASGAVALATFAALNPFLFAHPKPVPANLAPIAAMGFVERARAVARHRVEVSDNARTLFPNDALATPVEKVEAVAIQGFGRFGPFGPRGRTDSTVRFSWRQDWGAMIWLPWVALGLIASGFRGLGQIRRGEPPSAWAVAVQAVVALGVVSAFIPLAWDRYYLSIQAGSALLAAGGTVVCFDLLSSRFRRKPRAEPLS